MIHELSTADLRRLIEEFQQVQRECSPASPKWQAAAELLQPLHSEIARRQRILSQQRLQAKAMSRIYQ